MHYTHLGRTGLRVSPICLGTMNFGWQTEPAHSHAIMDRALELGINFFDTADVYGIQADKPGITETILGDWFAHGSARRERVVLATKVYNAVKRPGEPEPNRDERRLSAMKIMRHCDDSLRRMRTDRIDLYQMHHVDRACPWDEIWQAMETLIRQGKIVYVGSSNFAGWDIARCHTLGQQRGLVGLVSEQSVYNLSNRTVELEVVPACRELGLGLLPWSPLAGGLLGGALKRQSQGRRGSERFQAQVNNHRHQLQAYETLCDELGHSPADVALAWLLANPTVTAPIIGPRTLDQLEQAVKTLDVELEENTLERLDEIWPGPGGEAPKAYAW
ncbi:MAG: aldo/keto reductase [Phycisphaeraceae bacterium]